MFTTHNGACCFTHSLPVSVVLNFWAAWDIAFKTNTRLAHATAFIISLLNQFESFRMLAVPLCLFAHSQGQRLSLRRLVRVWLTVFIVLCTLYRPIHPRYHFYLTIPLEVVYSVNLAVLSQLILSSNQPYNSLVKFVGILLVLGLTTKLKPEFCGSSTSLRAISKLRGSADAFRPPRLPPKHLAVAAHYSWDDYHQNAGISSARTWPITRRSPML